MSPFFTHCRVLFFLPALPASVLMAGPAKAADHSVPAPAGDAVEPGRSGKETQEKPGRPLRALKAEIRRLRQQIGHLESGFQAAMQDLQLATTFVNTVGVAEGLPVLRSTLAGKPGLLANVDHVELLMTFDAAQAPMKRHSGKPEKMEGAYATEALVSANPSSMMLWGPFAPLEKGRYLITWRLKFEGPLPLLDTCFLDVCYNAVTFSGRRPHADETPAGQWIEASVPLAVPDPRPFEFRFWPNASFVALDRIYVYRLHEKPQAAAGPVFCSVMGAAVRAGTYEFTAGKSVADALAKSGGANPAGNPDQCLLHRQVNGQSAREILDLKTGGGARLLQHGDILEVPEK